MAKYGADLVLIAIPSIGRERFAHTLEEAFSARRAEFRSCPVISWLTIRGSITRTSTAYYWPALARPARRMAYEMVKRVCDVSGIVNSDGAGHSGVFVIGAGHQEWIQRGPVLFRQERVGLKRQAVSDVSNFAPCMANDANLRVLAPRYPTIPGLPGSENFFAQTSLDEVPQVAERSAGAHVAGRDPRPEMPFIVEQYTERHRQELQVKARPLPACGNSAVTGLF